MIGGTFKGLPPIFLAAGLLVRIAALVVLRAVPLASDALSYHKMALQLLHGESFAPYWPSAVPYYLAFFYRIFGASEFAGRAAMLLFYLLFSVALYLLAKETASVRAATVSSGMLAFFALFPDYVYHSVEPLTQLPTACFLLLAAFFVMRIDRSSLYVVLLGVTLALLILTRASSVLVVAFIPIYIVVTRRKLAAAVVPVMVAAVIVSAWIVKVHGMTGRWTFVNEANSLNFFIGNNPYTPNYKTWWYASHAETAPAQYREMVASTRSSGRFVQAGFGYIVARPALFLLRTANRIRNYLAFDTFTGSALIINDSMSKRIGLAVLALDALFYCALMALAIRALFELRRGDSIFLLLLALCYAFPYFVSFAHPTYHFPIVPLIAVAAAGVADRVRTWLPSGKRRYAFAIIALLFAYVQVEWVVVMWSRI